MKKKEVISIKNCSKIYKKKKEKIVALSNISYVFRTGMFYSVMGTSGSGKSTLINILGGLLTPDTGEIKYFNQILKGDKKISEMRNKKIGMIYQAFLLNENMTALENVLLPTLVTKSKVDRTKDAIILLQELGLEKRLNHYPKELSGGEQQRVAIARALINNPKIILADEPTGNLDKKNEEYIFNKLKKLSLENKCVIVVSHNEKVLKYSDVKLEIKEGKLYENK